MSRSPVAVVVALVVAVVVACGPGGGGDGGGSDGGGGAATGVAPDGLAARRRQLAGVGTWRWQLQGEPGAGEGVDLYDVDLFDVGDATVDALREDGSLVLCYLSAGSLESWRPDVADVPAEAVGEPLDGWAGERWLDVRHPAVLALAEGRLDLAVERGCDGVEPDNVTAWANDTGFEVDPDDQLAFNRAVADAAHRRGLVVALKNDLDQAAELVGAFDLAVVEECHQYDECAAAGPFLAAGKPVLVAEYDPAMADDPGPTCAEARALGVRTIVVPLDLDGPPLHACDG